MVTKVLTNYARVLMFLEDLVSLPEDCGQNSDAYRRECISRPQKLTWDKGASIQDVHREWERGE